MPYVMVRHKVADYAKWKRAVQSVADWRKASGEQSFYACRASGNPNDVMCWCEWNNEERMKKFAKSAELRKRMKEAGVTSKPEVSFWDKLDDLSVG